MTMGLRVIIILLTWCIVNCVSILNNQDHQNSTIQEVGVKCCLLIPRTPSWCFQSTHFNLSIPITIHRDNGPILITFNCLASNDATSPNEQTVMLDYSVFNITLENHLGQDRHLVQEIDVIVSSPPRYGQLNNHVKGEINITTFKLVELERGEIEYQFANQTDNDSFSWTFQYGSSSLGPFQLQIPIPEINVHVGIALVEFRGIVNLNSSHLLAKDNCGGMNDSLVYHILVSPQYGSLINQHAFNSMNTTLMSFPQTDLNNHQILYQSMRSDTHSTMQDQFTFKVCDAYRCSEAKIFVINIYHYNIVVVNTGFEVEEGSVHHITINELNILAPKDSIGLRFFIKQQPKHGNITVKTDIRVIINVHFFDLVDIETGSILYQNDGDEFLYDSFEFTATAHYPNEVTGNYETLQFSDMANITILPINDNPPEIVRSLESYDVLKGGSTNIPGSLLSAHDYDSDMHDDDIVWQLQVGSPYSGYMYLDIDRGSAHAISKWTEGDLRRNRLYYRNERVLHSDIDVDVDALLYTISDGFHTSAGKQIFLNLQEILFESTATANPPLHVMEGESVAITTDYLSYRASNDNSLGDKDFIYTVEVEPGYGSLVFNGTVLPIGISFSQQILHTGLIAYIHDHSNSKTDSFRYKLEVIGRADKFFEFQIAINSIDDDPPEVTYIQDPLFVVELSHVQINGSALVIYDLDTDNPIEFDKIVCTVERQPRYGLLQRDRFGKNTNDRFTKLDVERNRLLYYHTSLGHYEDSFTFKVTDGINPQNETYEVRIIILPEEISTRLNSNFSVVRDQQVLFKREDFVVGHPFLSTVPGRFILTRQPSNGILLNVVTNERIDNIFTTEDLANESIVYYQSVRNAFNDSFEFFYESLLPEGLRRRSIPKTVFIHIIIIDITNIGLAVQEGHGHNITTQELNIYASDKLVTINAQFNITGAPNHGCILVNDNNVTMFNLSDLTLGTIRYQHNDEENLQDYFEFNVVGSYCNAQCYQLQMADTIKFNIMVIPVNDNAPQFVQHSSSLNAVELGSTPIITSFFRAHDPDSNQRDESIIWVLEYTTPYNGYMYLDRDPGNRDLGITSWTEGDIRAGRLYYRHDEADKQSDVIYYRISDGYYKSNIEQTFIHLFPTFMSKATVNESFRVTEGYNATITTKFLSYSTSNNESLEDEQFLYTLQSQPQHGDLVLSGINLEQGANFTQKDLLNGLLIYVHDDSNDISDNFHYSLSVIGFIDVFRKSYEFQILIDPIDDDPPVVTIIQDPLFVDELNRVEINDSVLVIYDFDSNDSIDSYKNITCAIWKAPMYGLLQRNETFSDSTTMFTKYDVIQNQLWYNHTSVGHYEDSFTFTISDGVNLQQETYNVSIIILPDLIPIEVSSIDVNEGQQTTLKRENFMINHTYLNKVPGYFIITQAPKTGTLRNTFTNRNKLGEFTFEDLSNNLIVYQHSGGDSNIDTFGFIYKTDEPIRRSLEVTVFVHIHEVNLTVINTGFVVQEGQKHNITTQELNVHIPAKSRNFCFNITKLPEHGNLSVNTIKSTERGERHFVLDDLDTGHILYQRNDRKSLSDSFELIAAALYFNESNQTIEEFQMTYSLNFTILPINNVTTQELNIPFPINSTNISINITSLPRYGDIIISTISQTAVESDIQLNNLAIQRIFYRLNNDMCEQDSFIFQARIEYFDTASQILKQTDRTFDMVIFDFSIAFQELRLSLPPNPRALHLVNLIKKPDCGDIFVSTIKIIDGEQHFIQIEDLTTTRVFYQKKFYDNFEFTAVVDYFNKSSRTWETFQMAESSFNVTILPYPGTTQEIRIPFPANSSNIHISILKPPMYGNVIIRTSNVLDGDLEQCLFLKNTIAEQIFYENNGGENLYDSFEFTALTEYFSAESQSWERFEITESVNITISLLNDNPPQFIRSPQVLYAVQGGSTPLTSLLFSANDSDRDMRDEDIVWQLRRSTPIQGYIYLDVDPGRRDLGVTNWTEGDLRAGRLYYRGYSSESLDVMIYVITDGIHVSKERVTQVKLVPIRFESKAMANLLLNITEEDNTTINTDYLSYYASNDKSLRDKDFIYTLHSLPTQGSLVLNGRILKNGSSFNQQDLHNGSLIYIYDHGTNIKEIDSFQYSLSVVNRATANKTVFQLEIQLLSADHGPDPLVMTSSTQIDHRVIPSSLHAMGETALPRSLAQTRSTAILVGTMVPAVVIIAGLILLTSCITVIVLRHRRHKDYPENDHIYDYPDIQLPPVLPALQNKIECATVADSPQIVNRRKTTTDDSRCSSSANVGKSCAHNDSIDKSSNGTAVAGEMEYDEACTEFEDSIGIPVQENEAYKRCSTPLSGQSGHNAAPSGDHPMEYLDIDQTPFQVSSTPVDSESTVSHLDAVANTNCKIDAIPNYNLPPSSICVGIETIPFSCARDSNQLAPQNDTPTSMQCTDDSYDLKFQQTILDPNDAYTDSTLDPIQSGKYEDQSLTVQVPYPYDLKFGKKISAESIDSMNKSTANKGASIGSCSAAHQCNSYERIWGYEKIHHCDIDLPEHGRSSCITQSLTPHGSVEEERPTESNHSGCSIQSMNGYERVCGYEVIQHCDLKLEDLQ